jgi:formylglycine-generating enzyme required for sulfatase activity
MATRFRGVFMVPDDSIDQHENPVVSRNGERTDRTTGLPYEIWLMRPLVEFVLIPPGKFQMGSPEHEKGRQRNESPLRTAIIESSFYLSKYEITQAIWKAVTGRNPSARKGNDLPVDSVSWTACRDFLGRLNRTVRSELPKTFFRLPSEAEWEYACRAGTVTSFHTGDDENKLARTAWFSDTSGGKTHPVGRLDPNPWGLFDVHGNVYEWCADNHHHDYEGAPLDGGAWLADGNPGIKMLRGGGCRSTLEQCRSAYRWILNKDTGADDKGLRVILVLELPK